MMMMMTMIPLVRQPGNNDDDNGNDGDKDNYCQM